MQYATWENYNFFLLQNSHCLLLFSSISLFNALSSLSAFPFLSIRFPSFWIFLHLICFNLPVIETLWHVNYYCLKIQQISAWVTSILSKVQISEELSWEELQKALRWSVAVPYSYGINREAKNVTPVKDGIPSAYMADGMEGLPVRCCPAQCSSCQVASVEKIFRNPLSG